MLKFNLTLCYSQSLEIIPFVRPTRGHGGPYKVKTTKIPEMCRIIGDLTRVRNQSDRSANR